MFQEDDLNREDGASPLKEFQRKNGAIFGVQIILGATVGGKITRYPQRREMRPAKMTKHEDSPKVMGRVTLTGQDV